MKIKADVHIANLIEETHLHIKAIQNFKELPIEKLNFKQSVEKWSVLECIEHLNLYGDYYLPNIKKSIAESKHNEVGTFKTGVFGNYFTKMMEPKTNQKPMKTAVNKNPNGSNLTLTVIDKFITQQHQMLDLLQSAKKVNLNKIKTPISISKVIKLRLGDTFGFIIAHNNRHIEQAKRTC